MSALDLPLERWSELPATTSQRFPRSKDELQHGGSTHHSFMATPIVDVDSPSVAPIPPYRSGQPTGQAAQGYHGAAIEPVSSMSGQEQTQDEW
eukprot:5152012-Karenia_brevis.AAC.1